MVVPNAEKVDIPAMSAAVPKYQCLDDMDREWWMDFLSQLDASFHVDAAEPHNWLLNEIEKLVHAIPHTEATNYNTTLPQNLLKRHADHLKDIPEVKALLYVKKKRCQHIIHSTKLLFLLNNTYAAVQFYLVS